MNLADVKSPGFAKRKPKRVGRGRSSGHGKTCGRGTKGYGSRSGSKRRFGYEGGQMPLFRRIPKRGFNNPFKKRYAIVNVEDLRAFDDGSEVDPQSLRDRGIISPSRDGVKILGNGNLSKALTVSAHRFSKSAVEKIEKAGGKAQTIPC